MNDEIPPVPIESARRSFWERVSIVWLIPVAALAIALGIAWQNYADRGPVIRVAFNGASGVRANETELRYRDVAVGIVEEVGFSSALDQVLVSIRLDRDIAAFVDDGAQFWVVEPEVTAQGVSGLDTVLSGVFLRGSWDTEPGGLVTEHIGLEDAPLLQAGEDGLRITLRAAEGAVLSEGTPIFFKGITVGRVGKPELLEGGGAAEAEAVIFEPYRDLVSTNSRFWDTSGFSFSIGAAGAELDFTSLASLISGGLSFDTLVSGGTPAADGADFTVFADEASARSNVFESGAGPVLTVTAVFDENISGLVAGAPVELGGVTVGEVASINGVIDPERFGDARVRLRATLAIRTARMGLPEDGDGAEALEFLEARVAEGLRARLATASILTGGLKVELVTVEDAEPATFDPAAEPFPTLPTVPGEVTDVSATAEGVLQRINDLPIEALLAQAIAFLDNATRLVGDEELGRVPGQVAGLLDEVREVVGSQAVQGLPEELAALLSDLRATTADLRAFAGDEALQSVPEDVAALLAEARAIVASDAAKALPERAAALLAEVEAAAADLRGLLSDEALRGLPEQVAGVVADVRGVTGAPEIQALPADIAALVADLRDASGQITGILGELREAEATRRLLAAVDNAAAAAAGVETSVEGIPALVERLNAVAAQLETVPVDEVAAEIDRTLEAVQGLIGTEAARRLPETLNGALSEVEAALAELRAGGTVENVNATLASAEDASAAIADAARRLPALAERLEGVLSRADGTISDYNANSDFGRNLSRALREVQNAASALESLARAIERRPNSLILGR